MRWIYGLLGLALVPGAALAQDAVIDPQQYGMFGISGEATWYNFDVTNGFATEIDNNAGIAIGPGENGFEFDNWGGGGTAHVVLPIPEGPLGIDVVHLVVGGGAASDDSQGNITATPLLAALPIAGGIPGVNFFFGGGGTGITTYDADVDFQRFFGAPTVGWMNGNITLKVGPLVEFKTYDLDVDFLGPQAGQNANLSESVDVWSAGPMAAAMVSVPVGSRFSAFLGGQAAALYADGQLDGQQIIDNVGGGCSPCTSQASDDASDLAFMGRAVAGLSATSGRFTGSVFGAAEWRNDMYEIVNPQPTAGQNVLATSFPAAHLEQTEMWSLSFGIKGSIKLGGGSQ